MLAVGRGMGCRRHIILRMHISALVYQADSGEPQHIRVKKVLGWVIAYSKE